MTYSRVFLFSMLCMFFFSYPVFASESGKRFSKLEIIDLQHVITDKGLTSVAAKLETIFDFDVSIYRQDVELSSVYNKKREQYHVQKMMKLDAIINNDDPQVYRIYLMREDIYGEGYNFLFSWTEFSQKITVMSMMRFYYMDHVYDLPARQVVLQNRLLKLIMRRVGLMYDLPADGCVMQYSNSMDMLDNMHPTYCAEDKKMLIDMGVLKKPSKLPSLSG